MAEVTEEKEMTADGTDIPAAEKTVGRRFRLWDGLNRGTARLYSLIARSAVGRLMTAYRPTGTALLTGEGRSAGQCRPLSPGRRRVVQAMEGSRIMAGMRVVWASLADCPTYLYGIFLLLYGFSGLLIHTVGPLVWSGMEGTDMGRVLLCIAVALASFPLAMTTHPLAETVGSGRIGRWFLCRLLGVPESRLDQNGRKPSGRAFSALPGYILCVLAIPAAWATVYINPLVIPLCLLGLGLLGLIVTHPESGVVLSSLCLPVMWLWDGGVWIAALVILVTWAGYVPKLLQLHRTFRMGRLEGMIAILGLLLLGGGLFCAEFTVETARQVLLCLILLSDYYLTVNLMSDRQRIRQCLAGVAVAMGAVLLIGYARLVSEDVFSFLEGSLAGSYIRQELIGMLRYLAGQWSGEHQIFLVLMCPWLAVFLMNSRRLYQGVLASVALGLDLALLALSHSVLSAVGAVVSLLAFCLLYSHRALSAGIVALPMAASGALWFTWFHPLSTLFPVAITALKAKGQHAIALWTGVLRMIGANPAGIGLGTASFSAVYPAYAEPGTVTALSAGNLYLDVLAALGWPGLAVLLALLFLFLQRSLTALHKAGRREDRTILIGGMCTVLAGLLLGVYNGISLSPALFFSLCLMGALSGSAGTVVFDEDSVLMAHTMGDSSCEDRIYRTDA